MEKQTNKQAMETLYNNLYNTDLKHLGKNLNEFMKAKRILSMQNKIKIKKNKKELD